METEGENGRKETQETKRGCYSGIRENAIGSGATEQGQPWSGGELQPRALTAERERRRGAVGSDRRADRVG